MTIQTQFPFRVRLLRPWGQRVLDFGHTRFDTEYCPDQAQALVVEYEPNEEFFDFQGTKAYFSCEPIANPRIGRNCLETWPSFRARLSVTEFLYHGHPDETLRVPHFTFEGDGPSRDGGAREANAVAVVSNLGPDPTEWWPEIELRNRFLLARRVDVYGATWGWDLYRMPGRWLKGPPRNHMGAIEMADYESNKLRVMTRYHSAVCLENSLEPHYFTEKFIHAVMAGCVPIYTPHPSVRDHFLPGARWVDPTDFDGDVRATINYALGVDRQEYQEANDAWFRSPLIQATKHTAVWERIALILRRKAGIPLEVDPSAGAQTKDLRP